MNKKKLKKDRIIKIDRIIKSNSTPPLSEQQSFKIKTEIDDGIEAVIKQSEIISMDGLQMLEKDH